MNTSVLSEDLNYLGQYMRQTESATSPQNMSRVTLSIIMSYVKTINTLLGQITDPWILNSKAYKDVVRDLTTAGPVGNSILQDAEDGNYEDLSAVIFNMDKEGNTEGKFIPDLNSLIREL